MRYEYEKNVVNLLPLDEELQEAFPSYDGLVSEDGKLCLIFPEALSDSDKSKVDALVNNYNDVPDEVQVIEIASGKRKKDGNAFDNYTIAAMSEGDLDSGIDNALLKYAGFSAIRALVKDGLFHYALRVFTRDIEPSGALPQKQANQFKKKLRKLTAKHYPDLDLTKIEAGTV